MGLRGDDRITLADGIDLAVARDIAVPAVVDLGFARRIAKVISTTS